MLSIVVPVYNATRKIARTLESLEDLQETGMDHEVIFVDDCSTDGSYERLLEEARTNDKWSVLRTAENTGTAAVPRNIGIDAARGEYVYFLDGDDSLEVQGFAAAFEFAETFKSDVVRTMLLVESPDGTTKLANRVPRWGLIKQREEQIRALVREQSLTSSAFVRRGLLEQHKIRFPENLRIGEDVTFSCKVLANARTIHYRDRPSLRYIRHADSGASVTQSLSSGDFVDFFVAWESAEKALEAVGVSFLREHGFAALSYALKQYVWTASEPLNESDFREFSQFCQRHWDVISSFPLTSRHSRIISAVFQGDFSKFVSLSRRKLLFAGHDLKFAEPLIERLGVDYDILIDRWDNHTDHDEERSKKLLEQADLVWVEWLLGAAVWYSKKVNGDQRLVVRTHRSDMVADYGLELDQTRVSKFVAISPHTLSDFADRFDIPRDKFSLIPNAFAVDEYREFPFTAERSLSLALVGAVPKLKGFYRALELLYLLRQTGTDYRLHVYGKQPDEYPWVMRDEDERTYYAECERFISEHTLEDAVSYEGWADLPRIIGEHFATVSMSDVEGMQVSPGEAFCAGSLGLFLNWRGAADCYPNSFVFSSVSNMAEFIVSHRDSPEYLELAQRGQQFMRENYDWSVVMPEITRLLEMVSST